MELSNSLSLLYISRVVHLLYRAQRSRSPLFSHIISTLYSGARGHESEYINTHARSNKESEREREPAKEWPGKDKSRKEETDGGIYSGGLKTQKREREREAIRSAQFQRVLYLPFSAARLARARESLILERR